MMASIGPTLPPHLQKRKREEERDSNPRPESRSRSSSADTGIKRRRVLGPAPPPAPIDEKPPNSPREEKNGDESDSDDGYGPAPAPALHQVVVVDDGQHVETKDTEVDEVQKPQREEWMLAPPTGGDWNSRVDPTKLKNRRFNTGKGARGPPQVQSTGGTLWTETPEQKRKRLQDEVLGVANPSTSEQAKSKKSKDQTGDRKIERRIQDYKVITPLPITFVPMLIERRTGTLQSPSTSSIKGRKAMMRMIRANVPSTGRKMLGAV